MPQKRKKPKGAVLERERITPLQVIGKGFGIIGTSIAAMLLVIIIAVCIVITGLALYVTQFAETDFDVSPRMRSLIPPHSFTLTTRTAPRCR